MADKVNKDATTKGQKFDGGKERWDLMPVKPLTMLVRLYTKGAEKYDERNWEKGIKFSRLFAAAMRHSWKWMGGEKYDPDDGQHHLIAACWNFFAIVELEDTMPEMDDRTENVTRFKDSTKDYNNVYCKPFIDCGHSDWESFDNGMLVCQTCGHTVPEPPEVK